MEDAGCSGAGVEHSTTTSSGEEGGERPGSAVASLPCDLCRGFYLFGRSPVDVKELLITSAELLT